ncbi:MAG: heparinase II/III domain-containing protein [Planctomycetota bacterium]|jgi:hypothetical protein
MYPVPINEAEAIFAPFFDGSDSDQRQDKAHLLSEFDLRIGEGCVAHAEQTWCSVDVIINKAPQGVPALTMISRTPLMISGYDLFRVFACQQRHVRLRITGMVDGCEVVILDSHIGNGEMAEIDGTLDGYQLDCFRLEFSLLEERSAQVSLRWLGLANREMQTRLEERTSPYPQDWPHCLNADEPKDAVPELGLLFGSEDLDTLRRQCLTGPLKPMCDALRKQAEVYMQLDPESMVGVLVPCADIRWTRVRDNWKEALYWKMEPLALIGLIDQNPAMSRMAARMALSVAHCTHWCESPMGVHPGASWHHRSFQETYYTAACALVLDWAGAWITPHGKQVIQDAIIMKGLPRMESDFKRMEYIRYMNQGIVFSIGRVLGLLSLIPSYPRYATQLDEAERDLHEMIEAYILEDGVILEGPGYWAHSFLDIVPLYFVLARHRGRHLKDYATEKVRLAGDFGLSLLSTREDGLGYLGINDAHNQGHYPISVVVAYSLMSDRPEWGNLLGAQVGCGEADVYSLVMAALSEVDLDAGATLHPDAGRDSASRFDIFPVGGQAASVRQDPELGAVHLHLCSGPTYPGHYHEDKGSFILEAAGYPLVVDRGVLHYHEAENSFIRSAGAHSLLYPEPLDDGLPFKQPGTHSREGGDVDWGVLDLERCCGAQLGAAIEDDGLVLLATDNAQAWPEGLFTTNIRRICSPSPTQFLVEDVIVAENALTMSFLLQTPQPAEVRDGEVWITAPGVSLRVVPLNWTPCLIEAVPISIDDQHTPINRVCLSSSSATTHRLLTLLELFPPDADGGREQPVVLEDGVRIAGRAQELYYRLNADSSADVIIDDGTPSQSFHGDQGWQRVIG